MSSFYPPKIVARPVPSTAGANLQCRKCHEALAGLKSDEKCPKCGLSVAISMRGTEIRYSDPAWVSRLHRGAVLVLWGTMIILLGFALWAANAFDPIMNAHIPSAVIAAGTLVFAIGNWLLTAFDPSGLGEKSYGRSRKIARFDWIFAALGIAVLIGGAVARPSAARHWEFKLAVELCDVLSLIGSVALLDYLSKFAVRMRDTPISERTRTLCKGCAVVGVSLVVTIFIQDFFLSTQWAIDNDLAGLILSFQAIAVLSGLVLYITWILLLIKLVARLREQAKLARTIWEVPV